MMIGTIIWGDNIQVMSQMPDEYVDLVVTSPPYDNLRGYHGYTLNVPTMVDQFMRIMKPGGVIVWVVGDATINGSETGTSFRQALMFMDAGFRLHDTMIYEKSTSPYPMHTRYNQLFEYMLIFTKHAQPRVFNPIKIATLTGNTSKQNDGGYRDRNGEIKAAQYKTRQTTMTKGNIWRYIVGGQENKHPAAFPDRLAADHIISWSNEGDLVFDPMCGSGTTCKMAERLDRHWIGCDVSEEYCQIARERIRIEQSQLKLF